MNIDDMPTARRRGNGCGCNTVTRRDTENGRTDYSCGGERTWGLRDYPVGMVYASLQSFENVHELDIAMQRGTIFADLDLPFLCGDEKGGMCCG